MCYLCLKENPFSTIVPPNSLDEKKKRLREIKQVLREAKGLDKCGTGDSIVEALIKEQYDLAKEL
jgi:hypothetical protein